MYSQLTYICEMKYIKIIDRYIKLFLFIDIECDKHNFHNDQYTYEENIQMFISPVLYSTENFESNLLTEKCDICLSKNTKLFLYMKWEVHHYQKRNYKDTIFPYTYMNGFCKQCQIIQYLMNSRRRLELEPFHIIIISSAQTTNNARGNFLRL